MSKRDAHIFDDAIFKAKDWLKDVKWELYFESDKQAYVALRAVLHALRDRLYPDEAIQLGAQLPMLLRGVYYEGWNPHRQVRLRHAEDFIDYVACLLPPNMNPIQITEGIFRVLEDRISPGEIEDIQNSLPEDFLQLWPEKSRYDQSMTGQAI